MKRTLQLSAILITTSFIFLTTNAFSQICINNPSLQQGSMSSASGSGQLIFSFFENLLDYTDEENNPIRLEICMLGIVPQNGVSSINGNFAFSFFWSYDALTNTFIGIQSVDILGGAGGNISVQYDLISNGSCSPLDVGFVAEIFPPTCMYGINETVDDTESVMNSFFYTYLSTTNSNCFGATGTAYYHSGSGSFNFLWSTGATTSIITGLSAGNYGLSITDPVTNCVYTRTAKVRSDTTCNGGIDGSVIIDHNVADCLQDPTSIISKNRTVYLYKNSLLVNVTKTNASGNYSFIGLGPGNYDVAIESNVLMIYNCGTTNQQSVVLTTQTPNIVVDFVHDITPNENVCVFHNAGVARPGFTQNHSIEYCNLGTTTISTGNVEFVHDPLTHIFTPNPNSTATSYDPSTQTAIWTYTNLLPGECRKLYFQLTIMQPPTVNNGDTLSFQTSLSPFAVDIDLENNYMNQDVIVTGSYDPNDKQNLVGESSWGGAVDISNDQFKYYIRFQNTGTDTAFNVVIKDEIQPNLDISTVRPVSSSHPYTISIEDTNTLVFSFNNILLPDSTTNEPASNGYVCFEIDLQPNLPLGTVIENEAAIYFDFNLPVITNVVTNTITDIQISITDSQSFDGTVAVFPNPTSGMTSLELTLNNADLITVELLSVNGQSLSRLAGNQKFEKGKHTIPLGISELTPGLYLIRVTGNQGAKTLKVVKF